MSGEVVHFEIPSDDLERARRFYSRTFGWRMRPAPDVDYTVVVTSRARAARRGRPRSIDGGLLLRQAPVRGPTITIRVDDIDAAVPKIRKNGGRLVEPKSPIGDGSGGFAAYFEDPEGNVIGLFEPADR